MQFVKIHDEEKMIQAAYDILRLCGEDMYKNQGLTHWRTPYPIERIQEDCLNKMVYVAILHNEPVATFELSASGEMMELSKFAVLPDRAGHGIGGKCLAFMESLCKEQGRSGISLDVYEKSMVAIKFYEGKGFHVVGTKPTRHFHVLLMEKRV